MSLLAIFVVAIFVLVAFTPAEPVEVSALELEIVRPRFQCMCVSGMVKWYCDDCQLAIRTDDVEFVCPKCHAVRPDNLDDLLVRLQ